jgi:hypothetical protein
MLGDADGNSPGGFATLDDPPHHVPNAMK